MKIKQSIRGAGGGFTIVELLIVVVVVAILAAITVVAYNGIRQQASNAAIVDAASKSYRMIQAYVAEHGAYPFVQDATFLCITTESTCKRNSTTTTGGRATFETEMAKIGTLPRFAPHVSDVRGGVGYHYSAVRTVSGVSAPATLFYYLFGVNSNCGLPVLNGESGALLPSAQSYTTGDIGGSGATYCVVSIPGPTA